VFAWNDINIMLMHAWPRRQFTIISRYPSVAGEFHIRV